MCLRTENRASKTHVFGVGWGGHVNVPYTSYIIVCYAAKICGIVATLLVNTLLMGWGGVGWGGGGMSTFLVLRTL